MPTMPTDSVEPEASSSSGSRLDDVPMSLPSQHDSPDLVSFVDPSAMIAPKYELAEPSLYPETSFPHESTETQHKCASFQSEDLAISFNIDHEVLPLRRSTSDSVGGSHDGWPIEHAQPLYRDYASHYRSPGDGWGSAIHYDPVRRN